MKKMSIAVLILMMVMTVTSYADYFAAGDALQLVGLEYHNLETTTAYPMKEYRTTGYGYDAESAVNLSNGSGLSAGDNWNVTHAAGNFNQMWYSDLDHDNATPFNRGIGGTWARFQLARTVANPDRTVTMLRQIRMWNINYSSTKATSMGMRDIQISAFDIGTNTWTDLGTYTLPQAPEDDNPDSDTINDYYGVAIDIPDIAFPYYIQITPLNNWDPGIADVGFGRVGLAEVRFDGDLIDAWCEAADQNVTLAAGQAGIALGGAVYGGDATGTTWTQLSGPGTVVFTDDTDPATTATFPVAGSYVLALTETASGYADHVAIRVGGTLDASDGYSGLLGYWPLDGDANDESGNGKNGVVSGDPKYVDGKVGAAMVFDGVDDGVVIPDESYFDRVFQISPDMTLTFWAKTAYGVQPHGHAISKILWDVANVRGAGWAIFGLAEKWNGDHMLGYIGRRDENYDYKYAITGSMDDGKWHHYAFQIRSDGTGNIYVDGVQKGGINGFNTSDLGISNDEPLSFGFAPSFETGYRWKGELDEVRIYDRRLTIDEIQTLFNDDGGTCVGGVIGDINTDCDVNIADFALLAGDWLECNNYYPGDCFN